MKLNYVLKWVHWHWILCYFIFFLWFKKLHNIFNYVNPFAWAMRSRNLNTFVNRGKKTNKTIFEMAEESYNDKKSGIAIRYATKFIFLITFFLEIIILNIAQVSSKSIVFNVFHKNNALGGLFLLICIVSSFLLNNYFVFNKYLNYFTEYEKFSKDKISMYNIKYFIFIIVVFLMLILTTSLFLELIRDNLKIT